MVLWGPGVMVLWGPGRWSVVVVGGMVVLGGAPPLGGGDRCSLYSMLSHVNINNWHTNIDSVVQQKISVRNPTPFLPHN